MYGRTRSKRLRKPDAKYVIRSGTQWLQYWDMLVVLDVIVVLFIVPLRIGFEIDHMYEWLGPDIFMDILYLADMVLTFFRAYMDADGEEVISKRKIARRYLCSRFTFDILSVLPISYIALAVTSSCNPAYGANRLLRLYRLVEFFLIWERESNLKPSVVGIIKVAFIVVYMAHFTGCIFNGLTILVHSTQAFTSTAGWFERPFWSRYWRSFYWTLATLTGYNNSGATHWSEALFTDLLAFICVGVFGTIIGVFGNLFTNLDHSRNYFRRKIDAINDYMRYQKIPLELQQDVNQYYLYMWNSGKALENDMAVQGLPLNVKQRMSFLTCYVTICSVPFFVHVKNDVAFMGDVIKVLKQRIGLPGSFIVKKGEMGTEMFFITRGEANAVNEKDEIIGTLSDGAFFGEIALIYKTKRTATVVARTFCDMHILTKDDFTKVMRKYPQQSRGIRDLAKKRFEELHRREEEARQEREKAEGARIAAEQAEIQRLKDSEPFGNDNDLMNAFGDPPVYP